MAGLLERARPGADVRTGARGRWPHQCEEVRRHRMRLGTILPQPSALQRIACDRSRHRARDDRAARTGASAHSMALRKPAESPISSSSSGRTISRFVLEVLQYVPLAEALGALWERLLPGGRIVGVVPNADCPIVSRTRARFGANYAPPTLRQIDAVLQGWRRTGARRLQRAFVRQRSATGALRGLVLADLARLGVRAESPAVRRHQAFGSEARNEQPGVGPAPILPYSRRPSLDRGASSGCARRLSLSRAMPDCAAGWRAARRAHSWRSDGPVHVFRATHRSRRAGPAPGRAGPPRRHRPVRLSRAPGRVRR